VDLGIKGKVAVVTGSARGIGKAIASVMAEEGALVVIADVNVEGAVQTATELKNKGLKAVSVKLNIANYNEVVEAFSSITKELGPVDILVNNAAITTNTAQVRDMTPEAWQNEIAINLSGAFYCVKQVIKSMLERKWGRIVSISSVAGILGGFGQCSYSASKAGIIGLTKTIALEGARANITANAVVPGVIATDAYYAIPEKMRERICKIVSMQRPGEPEDIANAVAFLASEKAKYITGTTLIVSGGTDLFVF
jgi:3-oxoacyl-[acyl-carrier protein] reductase